MKIILALFILSSSIFAQNKQIEKYELYLLDESQAMGKMGDGSVVVVLGLFAGTIAGMAGDLFYSESSDNNAILGKIASGSAIGIVVTVGGGVAQISVGTSNLSGVSDQMDNEEKRAVLKEYKELEIIISNNLIPLNGKYLRIARNLDCSECSELEKKFLFGKIFDIAKLVEYKRSQEVVLAELEEYLGEDATEQNLVTAYNVFILTKLVETLRD